mmetsp:Transcript_19176/g.47407  ORF Transcript_19176/g.47407 Transcript_19176/m.47407 type:complete len:208 (+) Transcript_19176:1174-1797(+)
MYFSTKLQNAIAASCRTKALPSCRALHKASDTVKSKPVRCLFSYTARVVCCCSNCGNRLCMDFPSCVPIKEVLFGSGESGVDAPRMLPPRPGAFCGLNMPCCGRKGTPDDNCCPPRRSPRDGAPIGLSIEGCAPGCNCGVSPCICGCSCGWSGCCCCRCCCCIWCDCAPGWRACCCWRCPPCCSPGDSIVDPVSALGTADMPPGIRC